MNFDTLFYIYLLNAVLIIDHEIDSAYWQEWNLFAPLKAAGINGFLVLHLPLLAAVLAGLVLVRDGSLWGLALSFALCAGGLFAFFFHSYHLRQGRPEFDTRLSRSLLLAILLLSLVQGGLSAWLALA